MISFLETEAVAGTESSTMPGKESRHLAAVRRALKASNYRPVTLLDCDLVDGVVVLYGLVPSFYLKQMAQAIIMRLNAVGRIDDQVVVKLP